MRLWIIAVLVMLLGCSGKDDMPCPASSLEVRLQEADSAMARKARRLEQEGKLDEGGAVTFKCGYDRMVDGTYRKTDEFMLGWREVVWCLETMVEPKGIPLTQCLEAAARSHFAGNVLGGDQSTSVMMQVASKITCLELSREVDIDAERHGLQRTGATQWVPAVIWAVIQAGVEGLPAPSPTMFMIIPRKSGVEEACVDLGTEAPKRCTGGDGCPERPAGAEDVVGSPSGGDVVPPGTDPGTIPGGGSSGGDHT